MGELHLTKACGGICHAFGSFESSLKRRKVLIHLSCWPQGGKSAKLNRWALFDLNQE